jgi:hypothetical protein
MHTQLIEFAENAVVSARGLLRAIRAACIAGWSTLLSAVAAIPWAVCVPAFVQRGVARVRLDWRWRNAAPARRVAINLQYGPAELKQILLYVKAHGLKRRGRYGSRKLLRLTIWTHAWRNAGCRLESCAMFILEFDWKISTLKSVALMPGFDWDAFVDELTMLEKAALGKSIYGRTRREPTI